MSLDITPAVPAGGQLIQRYGDGGFRVGGVDHTGSVLVIGDQTVSWTVTDRGQISIDCLTPALVSEPKPDILIIGCGPKFAPPPRDLRSAVKSHGIALEWMDTGAACRTFNVLLTEARLAVAALIAVE